ncbi:unnamed protein product, partial [Strongylus vulgaris]
SVFATNVSQIARPRVSFSPTVRRPARRQLDNGAQGLINSADTNDENTPSETVVAALEHLDLF